MVGSHFPDAQIVTRQPHVHFDTRGLFVNFVKAGVGNCWLPCKIGKEIVPKKGRMIYR